MRCKEINLYGLNYNVYENGQIFGSRGEIKQRLSDDGYPEITVGKMNFRKSLRVHRVVALLFVDKPTSDDVLEVNHIDFNRTNTHYTNLEWCSHLENIHYSVRNNPHFYDNNTKGENNGRAMLSEEDVIIIRDLLKSGISVAQIARDFNRGWQTINHIKYGSTWKHI